MLLLMMMMMMSEPFPNIKARLLCRGLSVELYLAWTMNERVNVLRNSVFSHKWIHLAKEQQPVRLCLASRTSKGLCLTPLCHFTRSDTIRSSFEPDTVCLIHEEPNVRR